MAPLKLVVLGILVVALDVNVGSLDLLLDPVGYAVLVVGVHRLRAVHQGFVRARAAALAGFVASVLTTLLRRTETVVTDQGGGFTTTTERLAEPLLPSLVEALAQAAFVFAVCTALAVVYTSPRVRRPADRLRWALTTVIALGAALAAAAVGGSGADGSGTLGDTVVLVPLVVVAALVLALWFLVVLARAAREPALDGQPPAAVVQA